MQNEARLFGMDLAPLGRDLLRAWRGMLEWPVVSWLWPRPRIQVWLTDASQVLSQGPESLPTQNTTGLEKARYQAIVLPESLILRRNLVLPQLAPAELEAALALQLQTYSPFPADDLVWCYESKSGQDGKSIDVFSVMSSRKLVTAHIAGRQIGASPEVFEVWVPQHHGSAFVMMPGFAEHRRQSHSKVWRWASAALVFVALGLVATIVATPSLQLYIRSKQAESALSELQQKALPVLAEREAFTLASEKLSKLNEMFAQSLPPLPVLQSITQALADDTSLLSLQIQGSKVSISGQTANASSLMKQLSTTPGLRDVRAPAPATKPPGAIRESFTIEFMMDSGSWAVPEPAASSATAADVAAVSAAMPASAASPAAAASPASASAVSAPAKKTP